MPDYELARGLLDPGLFSDNADAMTAFYASEAGLPFLERLQHSDTYAELFFTLPPGKLKIQASTEPMDAASSGYRELLLAPSLDGKGTCSRERGFLGLSFHARARVE